MKQKILHYLKQLEEEKDDGPSAIDAVTRLEHDVADPSNEFEEEEEKPEVQAPSPGGLPGGVSLSLGEDSISIIMQKALSSAQVESVGKNVEKAYVYRYNRNIGAIEVNLQQIDASSITSRFIKQILNGFKFIETKQFVTVRFQFPSDFDPVDYQALKEDYDFNLKP